MLKTSKGFTIIELLIVVVVIGILAFLVISTFNGVQRRADATQLANFFQSLDRGIIGLIANEGRTAWWDEAELLACDTGSQTAAPVLDLVIAGCDGFDEFIQESSITVAGTFTRVRYDNDEDVSEECGSLQRGVNFYTEASLNRRVVEELDEIIDGGDGRTCGRVNWTPETSSVPFRVYFKLGDDPEDVATRP